MLTPVQMARVFLTSFPYNPGKPLAASAGVPRVVLWLSCWVAGACAKWHSGPCLATRAGCLQGRPAGPLLGVFPLPRHACCPA